MARFKIPTKQLRALDSLASLSPAEFEELNSAIGRSMPALSLPAFVANVSPQLKQVSSSTALSIIEATTGLYLVQTARNWTFKELLAIIVENASEDEKASTFKFLDVSQPELVSRLEHLLRHESSLGVTAKSRDIITEYERYFCGVRILSDIRPVFNAAGDRASAAVIVHNLSIHFHENREHQEFYVALDSTDLLKLKQAILRAEEKEKVLKDILSQAKMIALQPVENP